MQKINKKSHLVRVQVAEPELGRPQGDEKRKDENVTKHFDQKNGTLLKGRSMEIKKQQTSQFGLVKLIRSGQVRSS
jgi:hypothetical protein